MVHLQCGQYNAIQYSDKLYSILGFFYFGILGLAFLVSRFIRCSLTCLLVRYKKGNLTFHCSKLAFWKIMKIYSMCLFAVMLCAGVGVSFSVNHEREAFSYANMPSSFLEECSWLYIDAGTTAYQKPYSLFDKLMINWYDILVNSLIGQGVSLQAFCTRSGVSVVDSGTARRSSASSSLASRRREGFPIFKNVTVSVGRVAAYNYSLLYEAARTPFSELAGVCWARMGDLLELVGPRVRRHCGSLRYCESKQKLRYPPNSHRPLNASNI